MDEKTIRDRLVPMQRTINDLKRQQQKSIAMDKGIPAGTAFPTGISDGFVFFRTDLRFLCCYDGTRWLTVHEYAVPIVLTRTTFSANTTLDSTIRSDYAPYFTRIALTTSVVGTNNGTNYWTITIQGVNLALSAASTLYNPNTSADAASTEIDKGGNVSAGNAAPSNRQNVRFAATKTLAPGNMTAACTVYHKLIVT